MTALTVYSKRVACRRFRPSGTVHLDLAKVVAEPLVDVGGATSRFQEVAEAEGRVHDSFA